MAVQITNEMSKAINNLSREQIVKIHEEYGFAAYDSESTEELRDSIRSNIADGTIDPSVLDD